MKVLVSDSGLGATIAITPRATTSRAQSKRKIRRIIEPTPQAKERTTSKGKKPLGTDAESPVRKPRAKSTAAARHCLSKKTAAQVAKKIVCDITKRFAASQTGQRLTDGIESPDKYLASSANARISTRRSPSTLMDLLKGGEIKNQHQTHRSAGGYAPGTRLWLEESIAGRRLAPDGDTRGILSIFPKYGLVEFPDFACDPGVQETWDISGSSEDADSFGEVTIVFKDSVKERTSFCPSDTGNFVTHGEATESRCDDPLCDFSEEVQTFQQEKILLLADQVERGRYFEAQIWGPLTIEDIDYVVLPRAFVFSSIPIHKVEEALAEKGIPFYREKLPTKMTDAEYNARNLRLTILEDGAGH